MVQSMGEPHAIILVDHGSRRREAHEHIEAVASVVRERRPAWVVRVAHLELAEPFVPEVIDACVAEGARQIVLHPFFLLPGRHTREDLPRLAAEARSKHPGVRILVTEALGLHPKLVDIVLDRVDETENASKGE